MNTDVTELFKVPNGGIKEEEKASKIKNVKKPKLKPWEEKKKPLEPLEMFGEEWFQELFYAHESRGYEIVNQQQQRIMEVSKEKEKDPKKKPKKTPKEPLIPMLFLGYE
jgi:hypothetical protein